MLFALWNLIRACLVLVPNILVSLPTEPGPSVDTIYPLELRKICNCLTSSPVIPKYNGLVNLDAVLDIFGIATLYCLAT